MSPAFHCFKVELINDLPDLDLEAYYELDQLTNSIINHFEKKYIKEIEERKGVI